MQNHSSPTTPAHTGPDQRSAADAVPSESATRFDRGWLKLEEVDGEAGVKVVEALAPIAPDFARYVVEFPFGDIYSRPGLDLRAREIATVAALAALGNAAPQLRVHVEAALNVGVKPQELVEIGIQMAVYAGFPAALNALFVMRDVFAAKGIDVIAEQGAAPQAA